MFREEGTRAAGDAALRRRSRASGDAGGHRLPSIVAPSAARVAAAGDVALRFRNLGVYICYTRLSRCARSGVRCTTVLGLEPQPLVRFVNSLGLGKEPSIEPVRRRLARSPGVRFKLDAEAAWAPALVDEVAATGAVDTIDFKGQYGFDVAVAEALGGCQPPRARRVPGRLPGRTRTTCPRSRSGLAITSSACPTTRRSAAPRTSARRRWPRAW